MKAKCVEVMLFGAFSEHLCEMIVASVPYP